MAKRTTKNADAEREVIDLRLPLGELPGPVYCPRHVQIHLDHSQALALKRLGLGLDAESARLANGRRVASGADAIRYLLEQIPA